MADESPQAELEQLRAEVAAYRARELADLREALTAARQDAVNWRAEALRLSEVGRQLDVNAREAIARLKSQLETKEIAARYARPSIN